jgi:ribosomal protein L40E
MAKCIKCGTNAGWLANICGPCYVSEQERIKTQATNPKPQEHQIQLLKCPACSKDVSSMAANCPHCGHPFKSPQIEQTRQTNLWLRIIIILLCLPFIIMSLKSCASNL